MTLPYELIVSIVNKGHGEDVIEAALAAGVTGATMLHGHGSGAHQAERFYNLEIDPEKELIFTLVHKEDADRVRTAIDKVIGFNSPNSGILLTMPVTNVVGSKHAQKEDATGGNESGR